jgi:DNA-binding XRE family transcriptional regulator
MGADMRTSKNKNLHTITVAKSNSVRQMREDQMMSKAELARKAGVTVQTIDRIERGFDCRVDTKRKIIEALGCKLSERTKIFMEKKIVTSQTSAKSSAQ